MKKHPPGISIVRARDFRRNATDAERAMWHLLREHFPEGRWRRQVPLRHFICDFASHSWRLVVEVDGGQHSSEVDGERTRVIEAEGYRVVRFWNSEVLENPQGCWHRLRSMLRRDHPHPAATRRQVAKSPHPSPIEGEGG